MAIETPVRKAGTDKDARLLKNRPLTDRQLASIKFLRTRETTTTSDLAGTSGVFGIGEYYVADKARRTLTQLEARGIAKRRKDGSYSLTPKGKRIADK